MQPRLISSARRFVAVSLLVCASSSIAATHRAIVFRIPPEYPELARRMHIQGIVVVCATVRPDGTVSEARVQSGHALLAPAAQKSVIQWRFAPDNQSSDLIVRVEFNYGAQ